MHAIKRHISWQSWSICILLALFVHSSHAGTCYSSFTVADFPSCIQVRLESSSNQSTGGGACNTYFVIDARLSLHGSHCGSNVAEALDRFLYVVRFRKVVNISTQPAGEGSQQHYNVAMNTVTFVSFILKSKHSARTGRPLEYMSTALQLV